MLLLHGSRFGLSKSIQSHSIFILLLQRLLKNVKVIRAKSYKQEHFPCGHTIRQSQQEDECTESLKPFDVFYLGTIKPDVSKFRLRITLLHKSNTARTFPGSVAVVTYV
jgi:hypothetical protein